MFDLDVGKILIVGMVALVVVGPKDLPRALRALGRVVGQMRRMRREVQTRFEDFTRDTDLEAANAEIAAVERAARIAIAVDPRTAMRGHLPSAANAPEASGAEPIYASPEMRDYLAPLAESDEAAPAAEEAEATSPLASSAA